MLTTTAPVTIRHARPDADGALTAMLVRAFATDPLVCWAWPDHLRRARRSPAFFAWALRRLQPQGLVFADETESGAALWAQPGGWRESTREALDLVRGIGFGVGRRSLLVAGGLQAIEHRHPIEPHLYLAVLGVDPRAQGRGLGSALLQPGLDHCDDLSMPAYLETATERNLDFYARHGFAITGQLRLPKGPPVWFMWREPR